MGKDLTKEKQKMYRDIMHGEYGVSYGDVDRIEIYSYYLEKWGKSFNLVSRGTLVEFWQRHVIDSLQIIDKIKGKTVLDVGTGAGFPGMILAMCTDLEVTCVDSDFKKALFLEEVARATGVKNVRILNSRVEAVEGKFDTVTARAFSSLSNLIPLVEKHSGYGVFLKGKTAEEEIEKARKSYFFKCELFDSKTDPNGKIVTIRDVSKKPTIAKK